MFLLSFPLSLPFDWTLRCWVCVCCFVLLYFGCYVVLCVKKKLLITKKKKIYLFHKVAISYGFIERDLYKNVRFLKITRQQCLFANWFRVFEQISWLNNWHIQKTITCFKMSQHFSTNQLSECFNDPLIKKVICFVAVWIIAFEWIIWMNVSINVCKKVHP